MCKYVAMISYAELYTQQHTLLAESSNSEEATNTSKIVS